MSSFSDAAATAVMSVRPKFTWQQTMLRIKNPLVTVPFYTNHFQFQLIKTYHFPQWNFSLYFMATIPEGDVIPHPGKYVFLLF